MLKGKFSRDAQRSASVINKPADYHALMAR